MIKTANDKIRIPGLRPVKEFGDEMAELGVNFYVYDDKMNIIEYCDGGNFVSDFEQMSEFVSGLLADKSEALIASRQMVGAKLGDGLGLAAVLLIDAGSDKAEQMVFLKLLLSNFAKSLDDDFKNHQQIELVSGELAQTYEELMLLYKMSNSMKVTHTDSNYLQMACDNLTELVNVEGIAVFVEKRVGQTKKLVLTAGTGLLAIDYRDEFDQEVLYERIRSEIKSGFDVLLDSEVDSPFKYSWDSRVKNIVAVPLYSNDKIMGMMVATNRIDKPDFDSIDAKLFNSVANECAVFIENNSLFSDLKELFIGALKALTNSIDAKDQYTRGHSERVAFVSRWVAEHYAQYHSMEPEEIQKIYLAGLLHDVGKIGISELVLGKDGKLTKEEYDQIKEHPAIGAGILSDIKQMGDVVPGVLSHHERFDGKGYPNGLSGEYIPLAGKIVMVADTFDAMTSRRTYRNAMGVQEAIDEIRAGLGGQFDPEIGKLFIESDVEKLWEILQTGRMEDYYSDNFNDYGTVAVGALLR
ncbi:MAG: HD domain-containing protein [Anaerohalosphaeraceae bacterium]|nr:HD domain-containing protein [Anaerohalosphaeraceae bacterium]